MLRQIVIEQEGVPERAVTLLQSIIDTDSSRPIFVLCNAGLRA
jgi:hypothetical protein